MTSIYVADVEDDAGSLSCKHSEPDRRGLDSDPLQLGYPGGGSEILRLRHTVVVGAFTGSFVIRTLQFHCHVRILS